MDNVLSSLLLEKPQNRMVYTVPSVSIQKKVSLNSTSDCKEFAKLQCLQNLDPFLISASLVNIIGHLIANIPNLGEDCV